MASTYEIYRRLPGLVLGFHGCDEAVGKAVINGKLNHLKPSVNRHDWLGDGIYFWENDPHRAMEFAEEACTKTHLTQGKITKPYVVGAVLDLGVCLNLLERSSVQLISNAHDSLTEIMQIMGAPMPTNIGHDQGARFLDRAVMEYFHTERRKAHKHAPAVTPLFDSVRAMFPEGNALYDGAGFRSKNHIQIAIRNPSCIKGYFRPL